MALNPIEGKSPYFQIIDTSLVSSLELETLASFRDTTATISKYIVEIGGFASYLDGSNLTVNIPNTADSITFSTQNASQDLDGGMYWIGLASDGSYFRIGDYAEGTMISMYIAQSDKRHSCLSIVNNRFLLIEYEDWAEVENQYVCDSDDDPDDEDDDSDDETIEDRRKCDFNNIRVLVLFTADADARPGFNTIVVARNLIEELNVSVTSSDLSASDIRFTLANVLLLPDFIEGNFDISVDLQNLADNEDAQTMRDDNLADVVILLTDAVYFGVAGVGFLKAREENAYGISTIVAAAGGFTGSHEIGHIIGCRHQRSAICNGFHDNNLVYAHGYDIGPGFRTIMHTVGCTRVRLGMWSNRSTTVMGESNGNFYNDNAKRLKRRAGKVACFRQGFRPGPPFFGPITDIRNIHYIEGSPILCPTQPSPSYSVLYNEISLPGAQFTWEISDNGVTDWNIPYGLINNGSNCTLPLPATLPDLFFLRVTITASNQVVESDMITVRIYDDPTGNCELTLRANRISESSEKNSLESTEEIKIFPNPSDGKYYISGNNSISSFTVVDVKGSIVKKGKLNKSTSSEQMLDFTQLVPGVYWLKLYNDQFDKDFYTQKIILK